jgi:hypothetical protein
MKLPTLNVDLKLNSKNFKRDMANVGKGAAGVIGLGGGKAGLGNAVGSALGSGLGIGGLGQAGAALQGVYKAGEFVIGTANKIMAEFNASVKSGSAVMRDFNDMTDTRESGLNVISASRLMGQEEKMKGNEMSGGGSLMDTFLGASMGTEGQTGGVIGFLQDWGQSTMEGVKSVVAFSGGIAGGKGIDASIREADIATSASQGGAQAYATKEELIQQNRQFTQQGKYIREITS